MGDDSGDFDEGVYRTQSWIWNRWKRFQLWPLYRFLLYDVDVFFCHFNEHLQEPSSIVLPRFNPEVCWLILETLILDDLGPFWGRHIHLRNKCVHIWISYNLCHGRWLSLLLLLLLLLLLFFWTSSSLSSSSSSSSPSSSLLSSMNNSFLNHQVHGFPLLIETR